WHGTGTIKKFGQDVNTGKLKSLEQRANKNITHLIVNSPAVKKLYAGAFGIEEDKVYPIGMPKTDELLQRIQRAEQLQKNKDKEQIYQKYNIPADKKLVLYAPTFRDQEVKNPKVAKQLEEIERELSEEYYLGLRLHPHVAESFQNNTLNSRVCQLSYETDLNSLLMASDVLITDYSSILFDYSLTERPMVFYAYDLEEFSENGRGFYEDYIRYIPGPVAHTGEEVAEILNEHRLDSNQVKAFKETYFYYLDGKATKRLIDLM
ncbi:MAG: hypothetical protein K0R50_4731, partial [Eubacterium sp.]|nr:hypothetical protein [Eubacterium sp.]